MVKIKVSIIIPIYNVEKYMNQCLDSVINQTLNEIEIICVEDCSADNSLSILEDYGKLDSRIKIIKNETNKGLSTVRNIGMAEATGEYIAFLDSDDYVDLSTYEKAYNLAKENDLDCILFKTSTVDDKTGEIKDNLDYFALKPFDGFEKSVFNNKDTIDFTCNINVQVGSKLFRREFLQQHNITFPDGLIFEDEPFFYNFYLNADKISLLDENLYYYRVNRDDSIISKRDNSFRDIVEIFRLIREIIDNSPDGKFIKEKFFNRFISAVFNRFNQSSDKFKEEFFLDIKKDFNECLLNENNLSVLDKDLKLNSLYVLSCDNYGDFSKFIKDKYNQDNYVECSAHFIQSLNDALLSTKRILLEKESIIESKDSLLSEKESIIESNEKLINEKNEIICNKDSLIFNQENIISSKEDLIKEKDEQILNLNNLINSKDQLIVEKIKIISSKEENIADLNHSIYELNSVLSDKNDLISSFKSINGDLNDELVSKNSIITSLENVNSSLIKDLEVKKNELSVLSDNFVSLENVNKTQEVQINNLIEENKFLKSINEEVFSSNSWKITEPLRKFRRIFK